MVARDGNAQIQNTGNVCIHITVRRVCITAVAAEKQEILHFLSVCL